MTGLRAIVIAVFLLSLSSISISSESDVKDREWLSEGGHSILMEHYTASWCEICASLDPWVEDFASANSGRLARVVEHDPTIDPLGTPITSKRAEYLSSELSAPSFWFDGKRIQSDVPELSDLSRGLLNAESKRSNDTKMTILVRELPGNILSIDVTFRQKPANDGQLSIFAIKESVTLSPEEAENGISVHHDVVIAYSEISMDGSQKWSYPQNYWILSEYDDQHLQNSSRFSTSLMVGEIGGSEDLRFVIAHEKISPEGSGISTRGVASVSLSDEDNSTEIGLFAPLISILAISSLAVIVQFRQ